MITVRTLRRKNLYHIIQQTPEVRSDLGDCLLSKILWLQHALRSPRPFSGLGQHHFGLARHGGPLGRPPRPPTAARRRVRRHRLDRTYRRSPHSSGRRPHPRWPQHQEHSNRLRDCAYQRGMGLRSACSGYSRMFCTNMLRMAVYLGRYGVCFPRGRRAVYGARESSGTAWLSCK